MAAPLHWYARMRTLRANAIALGFALAVIAGVSFRLYHVDQKTFWEDEALGAMHSLGYTEAEIVRASPGVRSAAALQRYFVLPEHDSLAATLSSLAAEDPQHPPAFYLLTHEWIRIFGPSVTSFRSLSVLFGILVIPCAFWFARSVFRENGVALIFTVLVALSPFFVLYSQEAREYSLWSIATMLTCIAFLWALAARDWRRWILYALALAFSLYVFPVMGLVALGLGLYLVFCGDGERKASLAAYLGATAAAALAFAPWLRIMLTSPTLRLGMEGIGSAKLSASAIAFVFVRNIRSAFFDFGYFRAGPLGSSLPNAVAMAATVALVAYAFVFLVRNAPRERWGFVLLALCAPFLLLVARDLTGHGRLVYQARYFLPLLLGVQLAVAYTFARKLQAEPPDWFWRGALAVVLASEVASCLIASQARTWWNKDYERSPEVAAIVNRSAAPLVVSDYFTPSMLDLARYLAPNVALSLHLKCATCLEAATKQPLPAPAERGDTFALGIPDASNDRGYRWIDARPYPPAPDPLNMFEKI